MLLITATKNDTSEKKKSYSFNNFKMNDTFTCNLENHMVKYLSFRYEVALDNKTFQIPLKHDDSTEKFISGN